MTSGTHEFLPFDDDRWQFDTAIWRGVTNGLPALRWAPILDIDAGVVTGLLAALAAGNVPARAESLARLGSRDRCWRVWVDAVTYSRAEDILRAELSRHPPSAPR